MQQHYESMVTSTANTELRRAEVLITNVLRRQAAAMLLDAELVVTGTAEEAPTWGVPTTTNPSKYRSSDHRPTGISDYQSSYHRVGVSTSISISTETSRTQSRHSPSTQTHTRSGLSRSGHTRYG